MSTEPFHPKPRKPKPIRERKVEQVFVETAKTFGCVAVKLTSPGFRGLPDRLVLREDGVCQFVELKAPGKKATPEQARIHDKLRAMNFTVEVIDTPEQARAWRPSIKTFVS